MTPALRRSCLLALLAAPAAVNAEDEPLPRGAVARFVLPVPRTDDEDAVAIEDVALSRDGRALVATGEDAPTVAWDVATKTARVLPVRHRGHVTGLVFSPADDDVFASCSSGGDVRLWSFAAGVTLKLPVGRTHGDAFGPAFSPDGRWLVAGASTGGFVYWEIAADRRLLRDGIGIEIDKTIPDFRLAWSPDGAFVATGHGDGDVRFVPVDALDEVHAYSASRASASGLSWSPDGAVVCVVANGRVVIRRRGTGEEFARRDGKFTSGEHSPAAHLVAAGDVNGTLRLLVPPALSEIASAPAHRGAVRSMAFSGDGRRLATGGADGTIVVWDVAALAGRELVEPSERAAPSGIEPATPRPRVFPPAELRAGRAEGLAAGERIEPYAGALPGARIGDDEVAAVLVVDGTSGLPLPGATVSLFAEEVNGAPAPAFARTTTDAHGIAFAAWDPSRNFGHWLIEREGFSPAHVFGWEKLPRTVPLLPLPDVAGRILDSYGRPVAGGEVEFFRGCGHSPALRRVTTGEDGVFRLRGCLGLGGQLVVAAPGCATEYLDANVLGKLGEEPVAFVLRPGADVRGRVVEADGWPVGGITLRSGQERTAARTDAGGSFVLRGVSPGHAIELVGPRDVGSLFSVGGGGVVWNVPPLEITITVPPDGEDPEDAAGSRVPFAVLLVDAASGTPVPAVGCVLVGRRDGLRWFPEDADEDAPPEVGAVRFEVPDGEYVLVAGGAFEPFAAAPCEVRVVRDQSVPHIVRVTAQPRLAVRLEGELPSEASIEVVASGEVLEAKRPADVGEMHVPADGPAAVVIRDDVIQRAFPLGPVADGRREVVIAWPKPRRILVRGVVGDDVGVDGPIEAAVTNVDAAAETCEIETYAAGAVRIETRDDGDGRGIVDAVLPAGSDADVEVAVRRVPDTSFTLRQAEGVPLAGAKLRFLLWRDESGSPDLERTEHTDADGRFELEEALAPCVVELRPESFVPRRVVVRGDGEQAVSWGDAALSIRIVDGDGNALDGVLWIDGVLVEAAKGAAELRGLEAGRKTILVAAADRQPQAIDVTLGRGAARTLRIVLPELAH